ncbi:MAG TPA: arginase family protein [Ktedonobacterales bacterium]|jgi:arginase
MNISVICVPYQNDVTRWGTANGPKAFLDHGLVGLIEQRGHKVREPVWIELPRSERTRDGITNLGRIASRTSAAVSAAIWQGDFALVLAGDCTHALGPIGGVAQACGAAGVAWFDAHGDMNTMATTTSGLIGGLPYAVALGWDLDDWRRAAGLEQPVRPQAAALIGTSDLDPAEVEALRTHPIFHLDAGRLNQPGVKKGVYQAMRARASEAPGWYIHLDLDVGGPKALPGGLTPAPYWPSRANIIRAVGGATQALPARAATVAVYNPSTDQQNRGLRFGLDMAMAVIEHVQSS